MLFGWFEITHICCSLQKSVNPSILNWRICRLSYNVFAKLFSPSCHTEVYIFELSSSDIVRVRLRFIRSEKYVKIYRSTFVRRPSHFVVAVILNSVLKSFTEFRKVYFLQGWCDVHFQLRQVCKCKEGSLEPIQQLPTVKPIWTVFH